MSLTTEEGCALAKRAIAGDPLRQPSVDGDWGVPLLACLAAAADPGWRGPAQQATLDWIAARRHRVPAAALFGGGMASLLAGLTLAERLLPRLATLTDTVRGRLATLTARRCGSLPPTRSAAYDLITGASGAVIALATAPRVQAAEISSATRYLLDLCQDGDLGGLRHEPGRHEPGGREPGGREPLAWNAGRRNHGLAHGVPGVLAALVAASPLVAGQHQGDHLMIVRRLADYLIGEAFTDDRSVITWWPGSENSSAETPAERAIRRQAWCYGTPGVAWQLFTAGRLLGDIEMAGFAAEAMSSLCLAWDDDFYLRDGSRTAQLTICHGAPGTMAVARLFAKYAALPEAASLADHLDQALTERIPAWCVTTDAGPAVLDGTAGAIALLHPGRWPPGCLPALGLADGASLSK
jgi:lantibiotic biosynthesis protein